MQMANTTSQQVQNSIYKVERPSNGNFPSDPTVSDGTSTAQASTFTNVLSPIVQSSKRPRSNSDPNEPSKKISQDQSVEYSIPTSNSFSALQNLQDSEEINPIPQCLCITLITSQKFTIS